MELAYYTAPRNRKVSLLGLTSAGMSAALCVLPLFGLAVSAVLANLVNVNPLLPFCDGVTQNLMQMLNILAFVFPLVGLGVGIVGFIRSGRQCELSAVTSLFNVMILLTILAAGY